MNFEITDHVPGLSDDQVARAAAEAEAGYDLRGRPSEPNPHLGRVQLVPTDLLDAVEERAARDGQSPEAVVRQALAAYLRTA
ncbi:ribbon-helix-helix domain-containing protein [Nocardioides carbamazepini]|uniref:ribbon-helix-helix domain-containing protein n=1 Tax=Nocardioides carbamazepini TaxID=2854259 RepID=UPI00214A1DB1|nr:ribbon-helix-helix domain-containing protein [Nocardioides carbamazepini]MCR1784046.1 ribbon-helix-helix domain-containing protein [Nocardioides carbamazepini]